MHASKSRSIHVVGLQCSDSLLCKHIDLMHTFTPCLATWTYHIPAAIMTTAAAEAGPQFPANECKTTKPIGNGYLDHASHTSAGLQLSRNRSCVPSSFTSAVPRAYCVLLRCLEINALPTSCQYACTCNCVRAWHLDVHLPELHSCILTSPWPLDVKKKFRSSSEEEVQIHRFSVHIPKCNFATSHYGFHVQVWRMMSTPGRQMGICQQQRWPSLMRSSRPTVPS